MSMPIDSSLLQKNISDAQNSTSNYTLHASAGASIWALHTYITLSGPYAAALYSSFQQKFGYTVGTRIANSVVPAMVADIMPKMVVFSAVGGACAGVLCSPITPIIYYGARHLKEEYLPSESTTFQKQCKKIADVSSDKLATTDLSGEDDLVKVDLL